MRIGAQSADAVVRQKTVATSPAQPVSSTSEASNPQLKKAVEAKPIEMQQQPEESKEALSKELLEKAVTAVNEFLDTQHKASKFVFHEGLDKYFVKLVDAETEEVIKEIPPERLLDAFYEMQRLAGMIVDEKI